MADASGVPSKVDLRYLEYQIVFTICDCSLDKRYSFYRLERQQAERLIERLKHIEKMTWSQWLALPREKGLTHEIPGTESFGLIHEQNSSASKMAEEQYYFHFRVTQTPPFRVFGYQRKQFFCITHIDPPGKIHH